MEEWRDIAGYVGYYQVSNFGNVRSVDRYVKHFRGGERLMKGHLLKPKPNNFGYNQVCLCKNNKNKFFFVHRLVAETFIPNPDNLPIINHKDENRLNNCVENLEWCTYQYNTHYGNCIDKIKKQGKFVIQYTKSGEFVTEYQSAHEAQRQTGINQSKISMCCNGKRKSAGNFVWKYK